MLNLLEKYWAWRNKPCPKRSMNNVYTTTLGAQVRRIKHDEWVIIASGHDTNTYMYRDLTGNHAWSMNSNYFRDCIGSRNRIENLVGEINYTEVQNDSTT